MTEYSKPICTPYTEEVAYRLLDRIMWLNGKFNTRLHSYSLVKPYGSKYAYLCWCFQFDLISVPNKCTIGNGYELLTWDKFIERLEEIYGE